MYLIEGSETSAIINQTPGNYPKENLLVYSVHGESLNYKTLQYQLDATEVFIVDLISCSTCFGHHYAHHQGLKSIIQWLLPVVFRAVVFKLLVWCGAEGPVCRMLQHPANRTHNPQLHNIAAT